MNRFSLFNIAELLVESPLICWPLRLWEAVWASELRHSSGKWVEITSIQPHREVERSKIIYTWSSTMDTGPLFYLRCCKRWKYFVPRSLHPPRESSNFSVRWQQKSDVDAFASLKWGQCQWADWIDIKFEAWVTTLGCCKWLARPISCEPPQQF